MLKFIRLPLLIVSFIIIICTCSYAGSIQINGPDLIHVSVGKPANLGIQYTAQCSDSSYLGSYYFTYTNIPAGLKLYSDAEADPNSDYAYILGVKPGSYTISVNANVSLKDPKGIYASITQTESKTVTVIVAKGKSLCINGSLYEYSYRNKYFYAYVENYSSKPVKLVSDQANAICFFEKKYDSSLKIAGKKSVSIKPGKGKTVKFKVQKSGFKFQGISEYYIQCKCIYNKKTYDLRIYCEDSDGDIEVKKKGKWVNTMLVSPIFALPN